MGLRIKDVKCPGILESILSNIPGAGPSESTYTVEDKNTGKSVTVNAVSRTKAREKAKEELKKK